MELILVVVISAGMVENSQNGVSRSLKLLSKLIRILCITFCYMQLCGRCLVNKTPVVKVVIHCVFALLKTKFISDYYNL